MQNLILDGVKSQRLRFRKLVESDFEALLPFFRHKEAMHFFGYDVSDAETNCRYWIETIHNRYADNNGLMALEHKETGELIGLCGLLKQTVDGIEEIEIGYHIIPHYWGQGYAPEAAIKCNEEGFAMGIPSIISIIALGNEKSVRVAQKNGMVLEKQTTFREKPVNIYRVYKK